MCAAFLAAPTNGAVDMTKDETSGRPFRAYWQLVDRHYRWNLGIHLVQGAFALFAIGIFAPETVLAAYLTTLTKSRFLISLPWALAQCYWYMLSVFYCYYIERRRQRKTLRLLRTFRHCSRPRSRAVRDSPRAPL